MVNLEQPIPHDEGKRKLGEILRMLKEEDPQKIIDQVTREQIRRSNQEPSAPKIPPSGALDTDDGLWKNLPPIDKNPQAEEHRKRRPDLYE